MPQEKRFVFAPEAHVLAILGLIPFLHTMLHLESLRRLVRPRHNKHNVACFHDDPQSEIEYYDIQEGLLSLSLNVQVSDQLTYQLT
jgi:hypothetical protein